MSEQSNAAAQALTDELRAQAINWDNVRLIFAKLLEQMGPILMNLLIAWLSQPRTNAKP